MARLTVEEKQRYRVEGYVVPGWRLPRAKVDTMRAALDELIAANPGIRPEKLVSAQDLVLTQRISDPAFDEARAVEVELQPGQMSLHDVYMIHGATTNRSPQRRAGVAIRYMPGTSVFDRSLMKPSAASGYLVDFSSRPLWLLRGQDRTGKNDFAVGHSKVI